MMQMVMFQMGRIEQKSSRVVILGKLNAPDLVGRLQTTFGITVVDLLGWKQKIVNAELDAALIIPPGFADSVAKGSMPTVDLCYNKSKEVSERAQSRLDKALTEYKESFVQQRLMSLSSDTSLLSAFCGKRSESCDCAAAAGTRRRNDAWIPADPYDHDGSVLSGD